MHWLHFFRGVVEPEGSNGVLCALSTTESLPAAGREPAAFSFQTLACASKLPNARQLRQTKPTHFNISDAGIEVPDGLHVLLIEGAINRCVDLLAAADFINLTE